MDLLSHWSLRERPFEATWDTPFFYVSPDHNEALNRLGFLVEEQTMNIGLLTGEIGCGKTLTRAVFSKKLSDRYVVVTQENSAFGFKDLLGHIVQTLDPDGKGQTKFQLYERFRRVLERLQRDQRHLVLIFDEAQEMAPRALSELKLLTNLNGGGQSQLTIILLGQPELRTMVAELPAIDQRISLRFHLGPLKLNEAANYIDHRLKVAGHPTGDLFSMEAIGRLFAASKGIPRELNRLAKLTLELAWMHNGRRVSEDAAELIIRDLSRHQNQLCAA